MDQNTRTIFYDNNDELITSLIHRRYIQTKGVETAFRSVDRKLNYPEKEKHVAYRHSVWRLGQMDLSAPSVYAKALECLELHPGHKFLNIGSGVGYFSTVVGVLLGRTGINHGVERRSSVINYAYQKLEEFKLSAAAIDHYEFCEPVFIHGNAFDLLPTGYYDRVYCGARVPREQLDFVRSLIKIGGTLVMPFEGILVRVFRVAENEWIRKEVLPVSSFYLKMPENYSLNTVNFPSVEPLSLKELCRLNICSILRENLKRKFPNLAMRTKCQITSMPDSIIYDEEYTSKLEDLVRLLNEDEYYVNPQNFLHGSGHLIDTPDTAYTTDESEVHLEPSVEVPDGNNIDARVERDEVQLGTNDANTMNEQISDELTRRKTLEAGCS